MDWNSAADFAPVGLILRDIRTHRIVRTLGDAATVLINDWPTDDGEEYIIAVKACVDAISRKAAPEQFREALLRAANEAGIPTFAVVPFNTRDGSPAPM